MMENTVALLALAFMLWVIFGQSGRRAPTPAPLNQRKPAPPPAPPRKR